MTQFDFFSITSAGGRATNMDAIRQAESHGVACWVVADGLGGHSHSEVASKVAVDAVINGFISSEAAISVEYIDGLVQLANRAVMEAKASRQELRAIATTLVVLLSDGRRAVWAHVGDSRLYLLRAGQVATHTRDHSLSQAMAGVTGDDGGAPASNALILALGMRQTVRPRVSEVLSLCRDDAFILCVDGFWDKVLPLEMEVDFAKARSAKEWLRFLERRVCARQKEGSDNYTAWAVRFSDPKLPAPTPVAPILPLGHPNHSNPSPVEALQSSVKDVAIGDGNGAAKRTRSIGATLAIAAGLLLSWAVLAGGGFYVGRHQGTAIQNAAGKVDTRDAIHLVKAQALTLEDECLLAWAKIEKSRDPEKYKNFISDSKTRACEQADAARNYEAEVQAWRAGVGKSPQAIAAHVLKFRDSGSFPAQLQLAELVAKAETPPDTFCINVAKLWKDLTKRKLIWDDMPSVIAISRQAKDGNCNPTLDESQRSIASLFENQRASLASFAKNSRDFTPQVLSKILKLVDQARGKEQTDPRAAYKAYQEARTEMDAFNAAAEIAQEEARKKREREKELAREQNAAAERREKEAQEARKAQEEAARRKRSEALAKDEKAAVDRKASEAAETARKAREESARRQQDDEARAKVLKDMAAEKAADDARKAQEAAKKKEQDDARRRKEEEGG